MALAWERMVLLAGLLFALPFLFLVIAGRGVGFLSFPLVTLAATALYFHMRRRRRRDAPVEVGPRPDRRPPIPPVDDAAIASLPEPVTACPDRAYIGIRSPQMRDGLWPGGGELGSRIVCPRCGYQGLAVSFDKREDYGAFLRDLSTTSE